MSTNLNFLSLKEIHIIDEVINQLKNEKDVVKVVFDIDDTLWSLNDRVCKELKINKNDITSFVIKENRKLTIEQQKSIIERYNNVKTFQNINWFDGIKQLQELHSKKFTINICSNSSNIDIARTKELQIIEATNLPPENISMIVMQKGGFKKKEIDKDTTIFIDDSPFNISMSNALLNIIPKCPWNTSIEMVEIYKDKNYIYSNSLLETIEILKYIKRELLEN